MNKTPNYPDYILNSSPNINPKFSPKDILKQSPDQEKIGDKSIEEQQKMRKFDLAIKKQEQKIKHADENHEMKMLWSKTIRYYLITYTILMFLTLWLGSCHFGLKETTLNYLIIVGFAKVFGVVRVIVSHLFPKPIKN